MTEESRSGNIGGTFRRGSRFIAKVLAGSLLFLAKAGGAYYDETAGDQKFAYEYLEKVEAKVGKARLDSIPYDHLLSVAGNFGLLDRTTVEPEVFVRHIETVAKLKGRYYKERPLTNEEVKDWLLPVRLRYEIRTEGDWMPLLEARFAPACKKSATADQAARTVLQWMSENLTVSGDPDSYPLPQRGDLDPLSVLKNTAGTEVDLSICGVAILRSVGVASRLVWAPSLRGGNGGKMWLEYLGESRKWTPWVPSFSKSPDHSAKLTKDYSGRISLVFACPESPVDITEAYTAPITLSFKFAEKETAISVMVVGKSALLPVRGIEHREPEVEELRIGRGDVVIAASFNNRSFALLLVEIPPTATKVTVEAQGGVLRILSTQS